MNLLRSHFHHFPLGNGLLINYYFNRLCLMIFEDSLKVIISIFEKHFSRSYPFFYWFSHFFLFFIQVFNQE